MGCEHSGMVISRDGHRWCILEAASGQLLPFVYGRFAYLIYDCAGKLHILIAI